MRPSEDLIKNAINEMGGFRPAARYLRERGYDISESGIRGMNKRWSDPDAESQFEVDLPGGKLAESIDVAKLIERRIEQFARKSEIYEREKLINVRCKVDGPIGLALAGDWHLDDDGTDLKQVLDHVSLIDGSVEGMFAGNVGDVFNNWAGRLARLYAEQSTSSAESIALVEDILTRVNWLFYLNGNHDVWGQGGDILKGILAGSAAVHKSTKARLRLTLPSQREVKIYAVHGFQGKSMWSESYGAAKKAQLDGEHHDIYVGGHIHTSGYAHGMRPSSGKIWHAVQVASYKKIDRYAEELNLDAKDMYNMPVALIDPYASSPINFIRLEFDPFEAAERLKWMRARWRSGKTAH
jgi:UDP-2,3-diacylglucosamine pyrophosphatase LpxH